MAIATTTIEDGAVIILAPKGSLIGGDETEELKRTLKGIQEKGTKRVIIDMKDLEYLNSTAIGVLTVAHTALTAAGGKLVLCNVNKSINSIFLVTKLSTIFHSEDTRNDAILAIGR